MSFCPSHPRAALDEFELFGERPRQPPPLDVDNSLRGDEGRLRKKIRLFGGSRQGHPN
jgi:hypothetical protein